MNSPEPSTAHPGAPASGLDAVEAEMAWAVRHTVAAALHAGELAARDWNAVLRHALDASLEVGGRAGVGVAASIQGVARGAIAGVQDAQGDLAQAAHEIVRLAMQRAHAAGADVALVARRAMDGIAQGVTDAGADAGLSSRAAVRSALRTAAGLGVIATETVGVMLADALTPAEPMQADADSGLF